MRCIEEKDFSLCEKRHKKNNKKATLATCVANFCKDLFFFSKNEIFILENFGDIASNIEGNH
jgi:hypothetical protein